VSIRTVPSSNGPAQTDGTGVPCEPRRVGSGAVAPLSTAISTFGASNRPDRKTRASQNTVPAYLIDRSASFAVIRRRV